MPSSTLMSSELYCKSAHCKIFYFSQSGLGVAAVSTSGLQRESADWKIDPEWIK